MLKLWMAMTTGSMAKELNTRRGEGLHSRARSEHLIKKNLNITTINTISIVVNHVFTNKLITFYENSVHVVKWDTVRPDRPTVTVTAQGQGSRTKGRYSTRLYCRYRRFTLVLTAHLSWWMLRLEMLSVDLNHLVIILTVPLWNMHIYYHYLILWHTYFSVWNYDLSTLFKKDILYVVDIISYI